MCWVPADHCCVLRVVAADPHGPHVILETACRREEQHETVRYLLLARAVCNPGRRLWIERVDQPATR